jgi:small subunit ribosomal protein S5
VTATAGVDVTTVVAVAAATVARRAITLSASSRSTASPRSSRGVEEARKGFFRVPLIGGTIVHPVQGEAAAGVVMLRPASPGTGVIAGGAARAVLECAGVHDILAKSLGSDNAINVVHATVAALKMLQRPEEVAARRGLPIEDVAPPSMLRQRREAEALAASAAREGNA